MSSKSESEEVNEKIATHSQHSHHWLLSEPACPVTHGRCIGRGLERDWDTWGPEDRWTDYFSHAAANGLETRRKKK